MSLDKTAGVVFTAEDVRKEYALIADPARARHLGRFFKTGPGDYGEGDVFLGVTVPESRKIAAKYKTLPIAECVRLIRDDAHEIRFCGLVILTAGFRKADEAGREKIVSVYLANSDKINNWDLVDLTCGILGEWVEHKDRSLLYKLAESENLWEQRMAIVGTLPLIRRGDFADTLKLAEKLLFHEHDLMRKAVGWMLREVGKKDASALRGFLQQYAAVMPRTALRYAIEKFDPAERKMWMEKKNISG
ncbi:MAG: DNA alkylation repair protein [bacterium]|nr:DNA alkylation repair protein [bacterium]